MEIHQLDTTNVLLGVMAVVGLLEFVGILLLGLWLLRTLREVRHALAIFELERVAPLHAEMLTIAHEVRLLAGHAEEVTAGVERTTRRALSTIDSLNARVDRLVHWSFTEATAVGAGVRRGLFALLGTPRG